MTPKFAGWTIFIAALGMMAGLVGNDLVNVTTPEELHSYAFIGKMLGHVSTVVLAFIGGKLIPTGVDTTTLTVIKTEPVKPELPKEDK